MRATTSPFDISKLTSMRARTPGKDLLIPRIRNAEIDFSEVMLKVWIFYESKKEF